MAELGIVASMIGVAGAGFRLSLILNAVGCEYANAPQEIHAISKTITLYSLTLKQIGTVLQTTDSVHSSEVVQAAGQVANESNSVFDEINEMLDKVRTKMPNGSHQPTIGQRFRWCFKKSRINYLLAQLDSLKLSLSLMLQILQLGKLMAATSKTDTPEQVKNNTAAIQQERLETQNILIVRQFQLDETDKLYQLSEAPDSGQRLSTSSPETVKQVNTTIEPPPEYHLSRSHERFSRPSLGPIDEIISGLQSSSKEMVQLSNKAIDPLLARWTRWNEIREARHQRGRFAPRVDSLHSDEADIPMHNRYTDREGSPHGLYLEGLTTDWRQPQSALAKQDYLQLRKKYAEYQASVSAASSDVEDSPQSRTSGRKKTKRHVINSSPESSEPETEKSKRKDSVISTQESKPNPRQGPPSTPPGPPKTVQAPPPGPPKTAQAPPPAGPSGGNRTLQPPVMPYTMKTVPAPAPAPGPGPAPSSYVPSQFAHRPYVTPDQHLYHHAYTAPLPPIHTYNAPNPYANSPTSPGWSLPQSHGRLSPQPRQPDYGIPDRQHSRPSSGPTSRPSSRPVSRDSKPPRSPSRRSYDSSPNGYSRSRDEKYERYDKYDRNDRNDRNDKYERRDKKDERRDDRKKKDKTKELRSTAAKSLIGAGAIVGFLEALEGLDL